MIRVSVTSLLTEGSGSKLIALNLSSYKDMKEVSQYLLNKLGEGD